MRWLKELFTPSLKCGRVGHVPRERHARYYTRAEYGVANKELRERTICRRCKAELAPWTVKRSTIITSLSMPEDMWDKFYEAGEVQC